MKKLFLIIILVVTSILTKVCAQVNPSNCRYTSKAEKLFEVHEQNWLRDKFTIQLTKGNKIILEMADKQGLNYVKNLDSLLLQCYNTISLLQDSLKNETTTKRIDIALQDDGNIKMRFQEFANKASNYTVLNKELYGLKLDQDTVNIIGYYTSITPVEWSKKKIYLTSPYKITLLLNNVTELKEYLKGQFNTVIAQLHNDWNQYNELGNKDKWSRKLTAVYGITDDTKKIVFGRVPYSLRKTYVTTYLSIGMQNVQNVFSPSLAGGVEVYFFGDLNRERHFQLFVDNYFFFERYSGTATKIFNNDFLTFQYKFVQQEKSIDGQYKVKYFSQFSLGYLISRRGEYFDKNTFKVGLSGVEYHSVQLTPGFFITGFFKKVTPTISLSINLD